MVEKGALGAEIRALRVLRGLAVAEAARRASVSRVSLHRWEAGEQEPGGESLGRLLDALGADPRERARIVAEADARHARPGIAASPLGPSVHPGQVMRALREARGLTQDALAVHAGVSRQAVAKWEAGHAMPGGEALARATAALGAEALDLREGSLDLYDPIVDPLDARLRLRDRRFFADNPLAATRLLAIEREIWPLAARDARWEESLADTLAWRSSYLVSNGEHTAALEAATRAMRLAKSGGYWDAVYNAVLTITNIDSFRGGDPARRMRFWLDYAERARNPQVRALALTLAVDNGQGEDANTATADPTLRRRLFPEIEELIHGAEPNEIIGFGHPHGPMGFGDLNTRGAWFALCEGDVDAAVRIYERAYAADWERHLVGPDYDRFESLYYWIHVESGEPIPERGLRILDAKARVATNWGDRCHYHFLGRSLGTYAPPLSNPR